MDPLVTKKITFNSLPLEIVKQVLCNIDSEDLFALKSVCSYWRCIIEKLLIINQLKVSDERRSDILGVLPERNMDVVYEFCLFRTTCSLNNTINKKVLKSLFKGLTRLDETNYLDALSALHYTPHTNVSQLWRAISGIVGLNLPDRTILNQHGDIDVRSPLVAPYKWYEIEWNVPYASCFGVIALYPDNQTFSITSEIGLYI